MEMIGLDGLDREMGAAISRVLGSIQGESWFCGSCRWEGAEYREGGR